MEPWFQEVYRAVSRGEPAFRTFAAEKTVYLRSFHPRERLILLGGGHVAQPLCRYAADLGFAVTVVDDRPSFANTLRFPEAAEVVCEDFAAALRQLSICERDYVAVITRGHRYDADCLRTILTGPFPRYLGMIGSRRRVAGLFRLLEEEGYSRELLEAVHAPIGLPIGALTVQEIGISIAAELVQCRRQETPRRSRAAALVTDNVDLPLLRFLAEDPAPKALLTVIETSGSTPVKSGAMMAVDRAFRTAGTIGGGCGENAVLLEACRLIGSGESRCVTVDLSNDVAEEEGMVCGGQMKVFVEDLTEEDSGNGLRT
ncbi:XdhC/CoxI family protein [Dysosmobacter sp.]|uniref:XdhC/CoxI family protein n=1 Tax=Dysosmobacter sp. TaxID=2591382 RepID=UPI002A8E98FF|nr:XdhC/CoxI family protein [Dysosmobacter sp.]MDY3282602.1 XdhC/CoxI family protein [Dysosmobacter sp.]